MRSDEDKPGSATYTTARALLGILRLAQASVFLFINALIAIMNLLC